MNYYPFHIGDYAAHTGHLEPLEDLAYRRAIDAYMLTEAPLPADPTDVARRIRMRDYVDIVAAVLREFFVLTDTGWRHSRCDEEIAKVQCKSEKARTSAAKRWHSEPDANAMRTHSEGNAPKTQDPIPKTQREKIESAPSGAPQSRGCRIPDDFPDADALAWCADARADLDADAVRAKFRDYWAGVPGVRGRKADWPATWRNFVRSERPAARASPAINEIAARHKREASFMAELTGRAPPLDDRTIDAAPADIRRIA